MDHKKDNTSTLLDSFFSGLERHGFMTKTIKEQVAQCIEEVRPQLKADGGDIELIDVKNGVAKVKLKGACNGCPMSSMTLQWGVVSCIKKRVPEIKNVEVVQ
jgi:Fe-S cluster biogenesis protein NfuA